MLKQCKYCGEDYKTSHKTSNYCSRACRNKDVCIGKKHTKEHIEKIKESCQGINKGENNGMWNGNPKQFYPKEFTVQLKEKARERDNYECVRCGGKPQDVHHVDGDRKNNELDNLMTLCRSCHMKEHFENKANFKFYNGVLDPT
jgi:hypothetical protein